MGSIPVVPGEDNRHPGASVQAARGEKHTMRVLRFEEIVKEEFDKFLKRNGGLAPNFYQLKLLVNKRVEYNENWVTNLFNFLYFEASTGRHPYFVLDRKVYLIPKPQPS